MSIGIHTILTLFIMSYLVSYIIAVAFVDSQAERAYRRSQAEYWAGSLRESLQDPEEEDNV